MKQSILQNYFIEQFRRPAQSIKIPCGTKKPERIKLKRAKNFDRFELPILHCRNGLSEKIIALINVAEKLKIPVSEMCDSIDFDYGMNGNGIVRAHIYLNVFLKERKQIKEVMEALNDTH